jgi:ABC-2 type transport system permease protein
MRWIPRAAQIVLGVLLLTTSWLLRKGLEGHPVLVGAWVSAALLLLLLAAAEGMKNLGNITRREIGSLFLSPIAWVVMTAFLAVFGAIFSRFLGFASMAPTFYFLSLIMAFVIPMLTMRQIAEERRSGTIETLTTAPVTDVELVLGKFLGALVFFLFILLPTGVYVWILFHYSTIGPDKWMLAAGYLGTVLMGMFMLSFGLFVSSIWREQTAAAAVGAVALFLLWILGYFLPENPPASLTQTFWSSVQAALYGVGSFVSFTKHLEPFGRGEVDTREVIFFLSFTAFFLFLAVGTVSTRKWR